MTSFPECDRPALPGRTASSLAYCGKQCVERLTIQGLVVIAFLAPQPGGVNGKERHGKERHKQASFAWFRRHSPALTIEAHHRFSSAFVLVEHLADQTAQSTGGV